MVIFQRKLKRQKGTSCYSYRVPGKRQTKPPSFIHKSRGTVRAQASLCAWRLFSFQDWASSPAGHEMSRRDVIAGLSASREWTSEAQLCFSLLFWHQVCGLLSGLTVKGQKAAAVRMLAKTEYKPSAVAWDSCAGTHQRRGRVRGASGGWQLSLPWLGLVCSGPRRESFCFHGYTTSSLVGPERREL